MKTVKQTLGACLLMAIVMLSACKKEELPIQAKSYHFDKMGELLEEKIGPGCVGLQYALTQNGQLKHENAIGWRVLPADGLQLPYTLISRKSVHSCSKTITAAAMMHVLEANGVSPNLSIEDFLPARWNKHDWIKFISFSDLLEHRSGLRGTKDTYASMKVYIDNGPFENDNYTYANVNYTLMRILIPMVNKQARDAANDVYNTQGESAFDLYVSEAYIDYVRDHILIPAGLDPAVGPYIWDGSENLNPTRCYQFSDQSKSGYTHPNSTLTCGAGGWNLSARDYSMFLASLFGEQFAVDLSMMKSNERGMFYGNIKGVEYFNHAGAYTTPNIGTGGRAVWIHIPDSKVTIVIQINSAGNAFTLEELYEMVIDAYLESYY